MDQRVSLADGTELDMLDPESIRAYVRKTLAMHVEPSQAALQRLKMMLEVADSLPQPDKQAGGVVRLVDAKAAAEELQRRLGSK